MHLAITRLIGLAAAATLRAQCPAIYSGASRQPTAQF
jgi:hypothetical protein